MVCAWSLTYKILTILFFPLWRRRLIDGTEVIVETYDKHRSAHVVGESGRHSSEQVPVGHRNIITDLGVILVSPNSAAVATASHDGVIKIWKWDCEQLYFFHHVRPFCISRIIFSSQLIVYTKKKYSKELALKISTLKCYFKYYAVQSGTFLSCVQFLNSLVIYETCSYKWLIEAHTKLFG